MKKRFFALFLGIWYAQVLAIADPVGVVNFTLPAGKFYLLNDPESPFKKLPELTGPSLSTEDSEQALVTFNTLRSLRVIRAFIEGRSKGWSNPVDTNRKLPAYTEEQLNRTSNQLAARAGIDPTEEAPLFALREAVLGALPLDEGIDHATLMALTHLMLLEGYFNTGNQKENEHSTALKNYFAVATPSPDIEGMIATARDGQKIDLPARYDAFINGNFEIRAQPLNAEYPEFLGTKRNKIFQMLNNNEAADTINRYALPLIYADEGVAVIKSTLTSGSTQYQIQTALTKNLARFNLFKELDKAQNKASASLSNFSKELEAYIKNDIGALLAQPKATPDKAELDRQYINAYLEGLLVHIVNRYIIKDASIDADILNRWNLKNLTLIGNLKKTGLYSAVSGGALGSQLTELTTALLPLGSL